MGSTALYGDIERKTVKFRSHYIGTNFRVIVNAIVFQQMMVMIKLFLVNRYVWEVLES